MDSGLAGGFLFQESLIPTASALATSVTVVIDRCLLEADPGEQAFHKPGALWHLQ